MTTPRVSVAERRARLGRRHDLAEPATGIEAATENLVVLHASDPASVYLSTSARVAGATAGDIDDALFERRTMLRTLAMRRTLFVCTTATAGVVEGSSSVGVARVERKRLEGFLAGSGIDDPARWLSDAADEVLAALGADGLPDRELTRRAPRLATKITMGAGTKHAVEAGATSRVLGLLAVEGQLVRGRPSGDWTGRQYYWHRRDRWWPGGDGAPIVDPVEEDAAAALLERWLARFGPATVADMKWWTGWTMTRTRQALARLDTVEVDLGDGSVGDDGGAERSGLLLADDLDPTEVQPWAALLPALDPTAMGWKDRHWYIGPHEEPLFDRNGNIGPTVWIDGRIVGGWSQRPDGEVVVELLEPVGSDHRRLIEAEIDRVTAFVGAVVVKPSFPTPLQRQLSAGD